MQFYTFLAPPTGTNLKNKKQQHCSLSPIYVDLFVHQTIGTIRQPPRNVHHGQYVACNQRSLNTALLLPSLLQLWWKVVFRVGVCDWSEAWKHKNEICRSILKLGTQEDDTTFLQPMSGSGEHESFFCLGQLFCLAMTPELFTYCMNPKLKKMIFQMSKIISTKRF